MQRALNPFTFTAINSAARPAARMQPYLSVVPRCRQLPTSILAVVQSIPRCCRRRRCNNTAPIYARPVMMMMMILMRPLMLSIMLNANDNVAR